MLNNDLENLKNKLKQNVIVVKDFSIADGLLCCSLTDRCIIFANYAIKNHFIDNVERPIINCNSSYEKFVDDMEHCFCKEAIFNNINYCNDIHILEIVDKTNNLRLA